jgi:hypothetical protein
MNRFYDGVQGDLGALKTPDFLFRLGLQLDSGSCELVNKRSVLWTSVPSSRRVFILPRLR